MQTPFNPPLTKAKSYSTTTTPFNPLLTKAKSYSTTTTTTTTTSQPFNSLSKAKSYSTTTLPRISTKTHLSNLEILLQKQPQPQHDFPSPKPSADAVGNESSQNPLLNALNLSTLFPRRAPEEMSPRSLGNLSRLLSEPPRPSPRNPIASRWRQFHGASDWSGLLDPLNEDLRRELVRYGDLVQSSYQAFFHSGPDVPPGHDRPVPLPDRNYRLVRGLFATSSIDVPEWVPGVAPWMAQRSNWIGYVAVCDNEKEIRRVGRRDIVIALRGTATCLEWAENLRADMVNVEEENNAAAAEQEPKKPTTKATAKPKARKILSQLFKRASKDKKSRPAPKVLRGFWSLYKTPGADVPSLSAAVVEEIERLMEQYKGEELSITVTGHSLGAALAVLVADELAGRSPRMPPIAVFSFGGPRVGNRSFADRAAARGVKVLRVVNAHDVVTRVPSALPPQVAEGMDGYAHIGRELRVDSRVSPYLKPNADPACCHDLEAYLHLVDGYLASNCPFRSNAKRSLARLLNQQGSNLKQKYMVQGSILRQEYMSKVGKLDLDRPVETFGFKPSGYLVSPSS